MFVSNFEFFYTFGKWTKKAFDEVAVDKRPFNLYYAPHHEIFISQKFAEGTSGDMHVEYDKEGEGIAIGMPLKDEKKIWFHTRESVK
jgi:hypothetical protein